MEITSTIKVNTDWDFLQIYNPYIFSELKRPLAIELAKKLN